MQNISFNRQSGIKEEKKKKPTWSEQGIFYIEVKTISLIFKIWRQNKGVIKRQQRFDIKEVMTRKEKKGNVGRQKDKNRKRGVGKERERERD